MSMIFVRSGLLSLVVVGFVCATSRAVLIDDFSTGQGPVSDSTDDATPATNSLGGPIAGSIIGVGDTRALRVEKTNAAAGSAQLEITSNQVLFQTPAGMTGQFSVDYNLGSPLDLSADTGISISGFADSSAAGSSIGVRFTDNDSSDSDSIVLAGNANFATTFLFSSFTGIDFSQISNIQVGTFDSNGNFVDATQGADINLFAPFTTSTVPEPASIALWSLLSLAAIGFAWRLRKR